MRRLSAILAGAVSVIAFTQIASAADLPRKAPAYAPLPPAVYNWSGLYIGGYVGWAHNKNTTTDITGEEYLGATPTPGAQLSLSDSAIFGGGTIGYNFQIGPWVLGPEFEFGVLGNDKLVVVNNDDGLYVDYGYYGVLAGRIGYAFDRTLLYAKGGFAFAKIKSAGGEFDGFGLEDDGGKWGFDGNEAGIGEKTRYGWALGAGVEHAFAFAPNWSVKLEYLYMDFGTKEYDTLQATGEPFSFKDHVHTVKLGLNYRFAFAR